MPSQCCASLRQGSLESCSGPGRSGVALKLSSSVALSGFRLAAFECLLSAFCPLVLHPPLGLSELACVAGFQILDVTHAGYYRHVDLHLRDRCHGSSWSFRSATPGNYQVDSCGLASASVSNVGSPLTLTFSFLSMCLLLLNCVVGCSVTHSRFCAS